MRRQGLCVRGRAPITLIPVGLFDGVHNRLIMGMNHERPPCGSDRLKHPEQVTVVVNPGTTRMRIVPTRVHDHVDLVGRHTSLGHRLDLIEFAGNRVVVPVHDALGVVKVEEFFENQTGLGYRIEVGHPEDRRHPARCRGLSAGTDVLLVDIAGLSQMDMDVDHSRQDPFTRGVNSFHAFVKRNRPGGRDSSNLLTCDQ